MLALDTDEGIIIQSAAAIGSFACGKYPNDKRINSTFSQQRSRYNIVTFGLLGTEESVLAVNEAGAARLLLKALTHPNQKVVETVARSLKIVFLSKHCNRSVVFEVCQSHIVLLHLLTAELRETQ